MFVLIVVAQNGKLFCFLSCISFPKRKFFFGFKVYKFTILSNFSSAKLNKKSQSRACHHWIFLVISRNLMTRSLHIIQPSHEWNLTKNWYSSTYVFHSLELMTKCDNHLSEVGCGCRKSTFVSRQENGIKLQI